MDDVRVTMTVKDAIECVDLIEWLTGNGVEASSLPNDDAMGPTETAAMVLAGAATLRGGFLVVREWIRARRTTVEVATRSGLSYTMTTGTDDEAILSMIREIQAADGAATDAKRGEREGEGRPSEGSSADNSASRDV